VGQITRAWHPSSFTTTCSTYPHTSKPNILCNFPRHYAICSKFCSKLESIFLTSSLYGGPYTEPKE
jgi:hypothetical protein